MRGVPRRNRVPVAAEGPSLWIGDRVLDGEHRRVRLGRPAWRFGVAFGRLLREPGVSLCVVVSLLAQGISSGGS
jgi:hypothetical protein